MFEGNRRQAIAAGILTVCLLLALPGSSQALPLERLEGGRVGAWFEEGVALWQELWQRIESLWARQSVLIVPDHNPPVDDPESLIARR